jgi:hypothetical protein
MLDDDNPSAVALSIMFPFCRFGRTITKHLPLHVFRSGWRKLAISLGFALLTPAISPFSLMEK